MVNLEQQLTFLQHPSFSYFVKMLNSLDLAALKKGHRSIKIKEGNGFLNWLNAKSKGVWIQFILKKKADQSFLSGSRCPHVSRLIKTWFCFDTLYCDLFSLSWERIFCGLLIIWTFKNVVVLILPLNSSYSW